MLGVSARDISLGPIAYFFFGALNTVCQANVFNLLVPNGVSRFILENLGHSYWLLPILLVHDFFINMVLSLPAAVLIVYFSNSIAINRCLYFLSGGFAASYYVVLFDLDFAFFLHWQVLIGLILLLCPLIWVYILRTPNVTISAKP